MHCRSARLTLLPAIRPTKSAEAELQIPKTQSLLQGTNPNVRLTMCAVAVHRFCSLEDGSAFVSAPKGLPMQWRQCVNIRLSRKIKICSTAKVKSPEAFLLEGRRGGKRGFLEVMPTLFIEDESGNFSEEMLNIYGSYKEDYIN